MRTIPFALAALALFPAAALGQAPEKPVVYNNLEGDGGIGLDRSIKRAYAPKYSIVDTSRSEGFVEPRSTAGSLPESAKSASGQPIGGYVLVAYIVTAEGLVSDPVVLKSNDERLSKVALESMGQWRFTPGTLKGAAVATTAAQEFNFGPREISNGFKMERVDSYQPMDVLVSRMPSNDAVSGYIAQLAAAAHNYFVEDAVSETLHIVVVVRPGPRSRVWLMSSIRRGDSGGLEPLRRILEAVAPMNVRGGPVILAISGRIAGGYGKEPAEGEAYHNPVPPEWQDIEKGLPEPLPIYSDAFLDKAWPGAK